MAEEIDNYLTTIEMFKKEGYRPTGFGGIWEYKGNKIKLDFIDKAIRIEHINKETNNPYITWTNQDLENIGIIKKYNE